MLSSLAANELAVVGYDLVARALGTFAHADQDGAIQRFQIGLGKAVARGAGLEFRFGIQARRQCAGPGVRGRKLLDGLAAADYGLGFLAFALVDDAVNRTLRIDVAADRQRCRPGSRGIGVAGRIGDRLDACFRRIIQARR